MLVLRALLGTTCLIAIGLLPGACPGVEDLGGLSDPATQAAPDQNVYQVLGELTDKDTSNLDVTTTDELPNFGESDVLYAVEPEELDAATTDIPADLSEIDGPVARGTLAGHFINDRPDSDSAHSSGVFRGQWLDSAGGVVGVVRGEYRPVRPENLPDGLVGGGRLHGRIIDPDGRFAGAVRGHYGLTAEGRSFFAGRWEGRLGRLIGRFWGLWLDDPNVNGGTFAGRWVAFNLCDEIATLPEYPFESGDFGGLEPADEAAPAALPVPAEIATPDDTELPAELNLIDGPQNDWPDCIDPNAARGTLRGWHAPYRDPEQLGGTLFAHWRNANGRIVGALVGRYEPPPDDQRLNGVFYGKYVDLTGRFRGFARGAYGRSNNGVGVFRGRYFNRAGEVKGVMLGHWADHPRRPGGPFVGFWAGRDPFANGDGGRE